MNGDEKDFDLAEQIADRQRETAIRQARLELASEGTFDCQDCPNEIEAARRDAVPSARRCIACQRRYEAEKGKRR